jgi:arsenate reductase
MKARIYHNPRCSKSRETLALLTERGIEIEVVDYLAKPPSRATLERLKRKLDLPASAMVRPNEPEFAPHKGRTLDDAALLDLIAAEPKLLQRPIVEVDDKARIGRPPEQVLDLFE